MVRGVGIVGTGVVFDEHATAVRMLGDRLRLAGIAEIDEYRRRAATERCFVPFATNDHRALIERPDVDIVVVCTPPSHHAVIVADALSAGKYVVCEKPLAADRATTDALVELATTAPGRLSTVYQWRYRPEIQAMVRLRDAALLGKIVLGRFQRLGRVPAGHDVSGWWGRWDRAGGGAVMTQAIHEVDLMLHLLGEPTSVRADVATVKLPIESEDTASATVHFAGGAVGLLIASVATHDATTEVDLIGTHGGVHLPWRISARDERVRRHLLEEAHMPAASRLDHPEVRRARNKLRRLSARLAPPPTAPMHLGYWRAVVDALDAGQPLPIGPAEARRSVELVTAIYTSALQQRVVPLPLGEHAAYAAGVTAADYTHALAT